MKRLHDTLATLFLLALSAACTLALVGCRPCDDCCPDGKCPPRPPRLTATDTGVSVKLKATDCPCGDACGCNPCECSPPVLFGQAPAQEPFKNPLGYSFRAMPDRPEEYGVFYEGRQVGYWYAKSKEYHPAVDLLNKTFGPACVPPWEKRQAGGNFGIDTGKLKPNSESFKLHGAKGDAKLSREEAIKAVEEKKLPDDRQRLCLTILGAEADRKRVRADLEKSPELAGFRDKLRVQDYPPDHWAPKSTGMVCTGNLTVYVQLPSGRVLHRQADYADGPAGLAKALERCSAIHQQVGQTEGTEARRVPDPNYQPGSDPDLRRSGPLGPMGQLPSGAVALALAAGVVLLLFPPR